MEVLLIETENIIMEKEKLQVEKEKLQVEKEKLSLEIRKSEKETRNMIGQYDWADFLITQLEPKHVMLHRNMIGQTFLVHSLNR